MGLEMAGFGHVGLIENDRFACATLRANRPSWNVIEHDLFQPLDLAEFKGIDLLAGGLPCPPFSVAGKQLGEKDERNLFNVGIEYVDAIRPRAVMFENVRGMLNPAFAAYRDQIGQRLHRMGYESAWRLHHASDFGVPQLRPRVVLVAFQKDIATGFSWPDRPIAPKSVGETLIDLMGAGGWRGADAWAVAANRIAPTIVGGSKKHGGPDLGPSRARKAWSELGVDGLGIANEAPGTEFSGVPRLTVRMVARIQGFPDSWAFSGGKTASYRQVGNAFPPPFAAGIAIRIKAALAIRRHAATVVVVG